MSRRVRWGVGGPTVALVCALSSLAWAADPSITRVTLANGMRVVLAPDSLATAADVALWYATGSRAERVGQSGMTRLFERLMFRGSAGVREGEHAQRIRAQGGVSNTISTADYSCFWQTVPGEGVELALRLEADRLAGLRPSAAAVAQERAGVKEERRAAALRAPVPRGLTTLYAAVFAGQGYGRAPLGSGADLDRVTPREVGALVRERYTPANAVLTVVGRFEPTSTLQTIQKLFGALPKSAAPAAARSSALAPARRQFDQLDAQARILFVGWRGPGATDPDAVAVEVMAWILGQGMAARLPQALVQEGQPTLAAQAGCNIHRDASLLWTFAVMGVDADTASTERLLLSEVGRLAREPLEEAELLLACRGLETSAMLGQQTSRGRAQALGEAEVLTGDASYASARLQALRRLTAADVQRVARRLLIEEGQGVLWVAPTGGSR